MSTVVIAHSFGSDGTSAWHPQARRDLEALGHTVKVPDLPDTNAPQPKAWKAAFADHTRASAPQDTILVGHSIGGVNVLRFLEEHDPTAGAFAGVVLVATPAHEVGYEALAAFFDKPFDWHSISRAASHFRVLVAADDPVLVPDPFEHAAILVQALQATATARPSGAHFMDPELPGLVELVEQIPTQG